MDADQDIPIRSEKDIVTARQAARQSAAALGFGQMDQSRITTAVSELARNVVRYASAHGHVCIRQLTDGANLPGIEVTVSDEGPGIGDIEQAMQPGFTTGEGLGLGLSGTRRLMDEMQITSEPGKGTTVVVRKWRR